MAKRTPDAAPAPVSPLIGKSAEIAAATKERVLEMLGRHTELVAPHIAKDVATREADYEARAYVHRRMEGYENDSGTYDPGIQIFFTTAQKKDIMERTTIQAGEFKESTPGVWSLDCPKGVFYYVPDRGVVQIFREEGDFKRTGEGLKPLRLPYDSLLRIEGAKGAYWANAEYTPAGKKKRKV